MGEYRGKKITILKNNKQVECSVLLTISNSENGNDYVIYSDDSRDSSGNIVIYASLYSKDHKNLLKVDEKDQGMIETVIEVIREELINA